MPRTKQRGRRTRTQRDTRNAEARAIDENRTRRYLAFVRAVVGAARGRNASR